jgi:hypothetical protein
MKLWWNVAYIEFCHRLLGSNCSNLVPRLLNCTVAIYIIGFVSHFRKTNQNFICFFRIEGHSCCDDWQQCTMKKDGCIARLTSRIMRNVDLFANFLTRKCRVNIGHAWTCMPHAMHVPVYKVRSKATEKGHSTYQLARLLCIYILIINFEMFVTKQQIWTHCLQFRKMFFANVRKCFSIRTH